MQIKDRIQDIVFSNCVKKNINQESLEYWSDYLFAKCIFALIPLSIIAMVPAIIVCLQKELYFILIFDIFCFMILLLVGFLPGVTVQIRKYIFIFLFYCLAFVFLIELGNYGPGLVFLLASTIFILIFFPGKNTKLPFILTLIFSFIYGICLQLKIFPVHQSMEVPVMEWVAISSNVLFLSALFSMLLPFLFSKIELTVQEQIRLQDSLIHKNHQLKISIEDVKKKNVELEEFAFIASHDMQEPLRMISSFLEQLKRKYEDKLDDKAQQYIFYAIDGSKRMRQILLDLLEYSRAGKFIDPIRQVNLNDILNEFCILRRKIILEKSAIIEYDNLPSILGYAVPITQTLHCFLDNAIKYSHEDTPPFIQIRILDKNSEWELSIEDNGIGIEEEYFDKIFILFQRLHNRESYGGTGIGLSIVKKNIESWGGRVWLESIVNQGSKFYFTIPKL
ncbi:sensor histidine kinase [Leptospira sp. GIMC2001]|uniref:sensor histidine kinase n=1 Tax=Leptospira sp. GIMC2001 TaxID=1513297 RepID=UPI002348F86F|nr:ATP-binding protein [Leptospira sp. GIMC2001]WCL50892.1 ATP-binding protein [Leptospira sp. GIMC2001]